MAGNQRTDADHTCTCSSDGEIRTCTCSSWTAENRAITCTCSSVRTMLTCTCSSVDGVFTCTCSSVRGREIDVKGEEDGASGLACLGLQPHAQSARLGRLGSLLGLAHALIVAACLLSLAYDCRALPAATALWVPSTPHAGRQVAGGERGRGKGLHPPLPLPQKNPKIFKSENSETRLTP